MHTKDWQLYSSIGERKYLTDEEFRRFLSMSSRLAVDRRAFVRLIAYSGCRLSEALGVRRSGIGMGAVILPTLKRRRLVFRSVPIPDALIADLQSIPVLPESPEALWTINRSTAYRWVRSVMEAAGIQGIHASARGLRHAFGLRGSAAGLPQGVLQRLYGHATPATTSTYIEAVGGELRSLASRTW